MSSPSVRTTLALPADLLAAADQIVRAGQAHSRNDLIATALRHELAARERAAIDAAFATMGEDPEHRDEVRNLDAEFARAGWEALRQAEQAADQS